MDPEAFAGLLADLADETAVVDAMLSGLPDADWSLPTPAAGWAISDQASHLAYFDDAATLAATAPERFADQTAQLAALGPDLADAIAARHRGDDPAALLRWFRAARAGLLAAFAELDPRTRVPWYGPPMSVASSATARLMETWAHGQDIADALGVDREPTMRLRHVAHLGVSTFGFSFGVHGMAVPAEPVRVDLTAPDGSRWRWGPADAADRVSGPAADFCLVVTQRRHRDDARLQIAGPVAAQWMSIAQAFAGPPTTGPPPRTPGQPGRRAGRESAGSRRDADPAASP
jgi:uncharacterized protein (TIGR03084 family)